MRTADVTGSVQLPEGTEMVMPGDTVSLTIDVSEPTIVVYISTDAHFDYARLRVDAACVQVEPRVRGISHARFKLQV